MINQNENADPKQGLGETNDPKTHQQVSDSQDERKKEQNEASQEVKEDTSAINYGNIGVEGGVEDLDEKD